MDRFAAIGSDSHIALDQAAIVGDLSIGEQQRVEIAKSLVRGARILVLDEPTATLTPREADGLFRALRAMTAKGMGVIFISHKLGEVLDVTSRVTVIRHGAVVADHANDGTLRKGDLARMMCGRDLAPPVRPAVQPGAALLVLDRVSTRGAVPLDHVSLELRAGEIVGIAGVSGNGQRELADVVAGVLAPGAGVLVPPSAVVKMGIAVSLVTALAPALTSPHTLICQYPLPVFAPRSGPVPCLAGVTGGQFPGKHYVKAQSGRVRWRLTDS